MRWICAALLMSLMITPAAAADLAPIGHINRDINAAFASKRDSCLDAARAKVESLRARGYEVSILVVGRRGFPDTHALVHLRLDGETYYLDNRTNTLATVWPELFFILRVID